MAEEDIELGIEADVDEAQVGAAGDRAGQIFMGRLGNTLDNLGRQAGSRLGRDLSDSLGKAAGGKAALEGVLDGARDLERQFDRTGAAGKQAFQNVRGDAAQLVSDTAALEERTRAMRDQLRSLGADEGLFAVVDREVKNLIASSRRLEEAIDLDKVVDPEALKRFELTFERANKTVFREVAGIQSILRNLSSEQRIEGNRLNEIASRQYQERLQESKQANARLVVAEQGTNAQLLAETRIGGRRQLAEQQSVARRRLEIMRFAFRQIQTLERGIAGVFRASGSIISGAAGAIGGGLNRITSLFRRSNAGMNDGLRGALNQREQALSRSFRKQTNDVNSEIKRQEAALQKLNQAGSTGVLGALTGRGRFGSAFGAASLIGGGLTAGNLFTAGLDRFQSLEKANLQLTRMLGSAQEARRQLDELDNWARGTPLALDLVTEIAVGLLSMGTAADQVLPRLQAITDAVAFTGGSSDEIQRVSLAIRQIASAGRLLGQDFNQIAQALPGLNLAQLLADQLTGGDTAAFLKLRESGEISAEQFVEAFVAGVNSNDAIGGSTASLANTLQGQISNLNAAWRRLGAAFITQFEGPLRSSIKRLRDNLSLLAKFVTGDVNPTLLALRGAIVGVGIALGALVAAKTAIQTIQLLGVVAQLALTPMGLLVTAVLAIGAAVGALRVANDNFRYITDGIRDLASTALVSGVQLLAVALRAFGRFLSDTVVPGLVRLGQMALPVLITAVRVLVAIFNAVLIPAVQAAFGFMVNTAIPAALGLASSLRQYLIPAVIALGAAWFVANAPLATVVATVAVVAAALFVLRRNFDSVRDVTDNLADSFVVLGAKLASIGRDVGGKVAAAFQAIGAALSDLFTSIDYEALGLAVLGFVNTLGRLLGQAITSRVAVTAAIAIGVAAAALAGSFLLGFTEGVVKGLPGAIDQVIDLIQIGLEEAGLPSIVTGLFSNAFTGIGALIVASILVSSVLRSLTGAGSRAAGAFSGGFGAGIRNGFTNTFRSLEALRFPTTAIQAQARDQAVAYQREFDRIMRNNRRLGTGSALVSSGTISRDALDATAIRRLNAEQTRFIEGAGRATTAAILFRRTWGDALRDTGNRWQAVQDRVAQTGGWGAVGQRAGVTLVTAFSAALAGRQGGTAGLVGVVMASLGALAIGGPLVGGITALVGGATLLWTELNKADAIMKAIEETTLRLVDLLEGLAGDEFGAALAGSLSDAVVDSVSELGGATALSILPEGFFARTAREVEQGTFDLDNAFTAIARQLGLNVEEIQTLLDSVNPDDFLAFISGAGDGKKLLGFTDQQVEAYEALESRLRLAGVSGEAFAAILTAVKVQSESAAGAMDILDEKARLLTDGLSTIDIGFFNDMEARAGGAGNAFAKAGEELSTWERIVGRLDAVQGAFGQVTSVIDRLGLTGVNVFEQVRAELERTGTFLDSDMIQYLRDLIDEWYRVGLASDRAQRLMKIDEGYWADVEARGGSLRNLGDAAVEAAEELEELASVTSLVGTAITELNNQRTERLRGQIDTLRNGLEFAESAAERARTALTNFLTGGYGGSAEAQVDALIGNLGSIGSRIEDAMNLGGLRGDAAARAAVGDFGSQVATIIQAGIDEGLSTQDQFRNLLAPLFAVLDEEGQDAARRILSTVDFDSGVVGPAATRIRDELNRIVGGTDLEANVRGVFAADAEVQRIQRQLDALEAELDVKVIFDEAQIRKALTDAGASGALADAALAGVNNLTAQQLGGLVAAVAAATAEFNAQGVTGGGDTVMTNDITFINYIDGSQSPAQTASAVVGAANAAVTGITPAMIVYGTNLARSNSRVPRGAI